MSNKTTKRIGGIAVLAALSIGSWSGAQACTASTIYGECTLADKLDDYLDGPVPTTPVAEGTDATWQLEGSVGLASIIMELAGYAPYNTFGIYEVGNESNKLQVFTGSDYNSAYNGQVLLVSQLNSGPNAGKYQFSVLGRGNAVFASTQFGFYLTTPQDNAGYVYYSDSNLNFDHVDHMQAFQGNGSVFNAASPMAGMPYDAHSYLLGFEDLKGGGDEDYQDMVVLMRDAQPTSTTPVPLPAAAWLLMSGLASVAAIGRRRQKPVANNVSA